MNPSGAPPPGDAFWPPIRRVAAAVQGPRDPNDPYDPIRPRPYPALPMGMSLEHSRDRPAHAEHLITVQIDSISPTDRVGDRVAHLEDAARARCQRFRRRPPRALFLVPPRRAARGGLPALPIRACDPTAPGGGDTRRLCHTYRRALPPTWAWAGPGVPCRPPEYSGGVPAAPSFSFPFPSTLGFQPRSCRRGPALHPCCRPYVGLPTAVPPLGPTQALPA